MEGNYVRSKIEGTLLSFLKSHGIATGASIIVAYSGGPDSTALLAAMAAIGAPRLRAVHVDHGIRPAQERVTELAFVRRSCARLGLPLTVARVRPSAVLAMAAQEGIEAAARRYRYSALRSVMEKKSATCILLAHTRDDQLETLLMRLLGGAGSGGLRGISAARAPLYRPFLGLAKDELLAYLSERGLEYSSDSTNASREYLRNRVRLRLVPLLDEAFPGWRSGLSRTAERAALDAAALDAAAAGLRFRSMTDGRLAVDAEAFFAAPEGIRLRVLVEAAGALVGRERFSLRLARAALQAVEEGEKKRYRSGDIELKSEAGRVVLGRCLDFPRRGGYFVVIDRPCRIRAGRLVVRAAWTSGAGSGIRAEAFRFPLVVRSRRPGDAIALQGGMKRLDELLSEWGLPLALREAVPVIEDRDGIVAVLGAAWGAGNRYRRGLEPDEGKKLRLTVAVKGA